MNLAHVPSATITGAHIFRDASNVIVITTFRAASRVKAYSMLSRDERSVMMRLLGSSLHVLDWMERADMRPMEVPRGLRLDGWIYDRENVIPPPTIDETVQLPDRRQGPRRRGDEQAPRPRLRQHSA